MSRPPPNSTLFPYTALFRPPAQLQITRRDLPSYRDLRIRYAGQALVHRHEPSGTLHGLLRVRSITQDDAHIFCTPEQVQPEVSGCLDFGFFLYDVFGIEPRLELSTRPEIGRASCRERE